LPIKIAIVGAGAHAQQHLLPALRVIDGVRLVSVHCRSAANAQLAAQRWGIETWSTDWASALDPAKCDAVLVCAPPDVHTAAALLALRVGLPIFVEKPPAISTPVLSELLNLERQSNSKVMVGLNLLFSSTIRRMITLIAEHGPPRLIKITCLANKPKEVLWDSYGLARSIMLAVGIHGLSVACLFCRDLKYSWSHITEIGPKEIGISMALLSPNGVSATIEFGNYANRFIFEVEIVTNTGTVLMTRNLRSIEIYRRSHTNAASIDSKETTRWVAGGLDGGGEAAGYLPELNHFVTEVIAGSAFDAGLAETLQLYEIIDQALDRSSVR
jgi:predicted dehydrogenase